ncbi:tautomerase family protein [Vulcaniibacterium tengchongense]|uniref:Tautomerase-like protein n=1 Tax=Vulcaniibacterium tengchongense TaxID=1273429 RepID=A0A3N4VHQ8_9GAMM|nr:hypothetical protein [Vulcaniibacterium tengchongense]RPE81035.1 hypothetical protein EDC50_0202 [Vulcaniibacterium tengchongense]
MGAAATAGRRSGGRRATGARCNRPRTNTKEQKARYIREAFDGFARLLGDLHEESYIYVQDVRAAAYGYGGRTQEARFHLPG